MDIVLMTLCLSIMIFCAAIIFVQMRTIERLTDRLMARNYAEYIYTTKPTETPTEESREPLSWYDDPGINGRDTN